MDCGQIFISQESQKSTIEECDQFNTEKDLTGYFDSDCESSELLRNISSFVSPSV